MRIVYMQMKSMIKSENISKVAPYLWFAASEAFALAAIIAVGWFLIGYYTQFEFLQTGYQDWIYQAFRVQSIERYGITSWEHVWSNGINHWRAYQYIPSMLVYLVTKVFHLSIPHAILWASAVTFILIRIFLYGVLRSFGIGRFFAVFSAIVSYAFVQQWIELKDFSIYIAMLAVPLYVILWVKALHDNRYFYILAAVSGALWSLHPVLGYSLSGLWIVLLFANRETKNLRRFSLAILIFLLSSSPFSSQYLLAGYNFINPLFTSPQFLRESLVSDHFGLSLLYFILLALCWVILLVKSPELPRWSKLLLAYSSFYLFFIYLGQQGYFPDFVNLFQFSRAVPIIALLLAICFGVFFEVAFGGIGSRMIPMIVIVIMAVAIVNAIDIGSIYTGVPVRSIQDPVAMYFSNHELPLGSVYFENVSEASYFGQAEIRYVTSYNEYLMPNPYSTRFRNLMRTDIAYTGISSSQIRLIEDYSTVLGVSHIFIPSLSPLVTGLTEGDDPMFEKEGEIVSGESYAVLKNLYPITNAYVFESENTNDFLRFSDLPKPGLRADSFQSWDDEIARMAQLMRDGQLKPLPIHFIWPNRLVVDTENAQDMRQPVLFLTQSYDQNWVVQNEKGAMTKPTNLRFMEVNLPEGKIPNTITLSNNWPRWHWFVQSLGLIMIAVTGAIAIVRRRKREIIMKNEV